MLSHRRTVSHSDQISDVLLRGTRGVGEAEIQDTEEPKAGMASWMDELKVNERSNGCVGPLFRVVTRVIVYFWEILSLPSPPRPFLKPRIFVSIEIESK